jgi:hypothetical protein
MFGLLAAYCADSVFYRGFYGETVLTLSRHIVRGVLMGLMHLA